MTFQIKVDVSQAVKRIGSLRRALPDIVDRAMMQEHEEMRAEFERTPYPPPPANSKYIRTYTLKGSWGKRRTQKTSTYIEWAITNTATSPRGIHYASYPVGDEKGRQAWMHAGRWWVAVDMRGQRIERLKRAIKDAIILYAKQAGGRL